MVRSGLLLGSVIGLSRRLVEFGRQLLASALAECLLEKPARLLALGTLKTMRLDTRASIAGNNDLDLHIEPPT